MLLPHRISVKAGLLGPDRLLGHLAIADARRASERVVSFLREHKFHCRLVFPSSHWMMRSTSGVAPSRVCSR